MRQIICGCVAAALLLCRTVAAGPEEDYKEAQLMYVTSVASFAAYPGVDGDIAAALMRREGWVIIPYIAKADQMTDEKVQVKFLMAWKKALETPREFLLAIAGTYNANGMKMFFRAGKIYFSGTTYEEFQINADKKDDIPKTAPMVHRGFHQYVQAALSADVYPPTVETPGRKLGDILLEHPDWVVWLTGHSSGGSSATLMGARLISMGVKPEQVKIISFAAPAIGNDAFGEKYSPVLDLTRVVVAGDVIPNSLRKLYGEYRQFGREVRWQIDGYTFDEKHYPSIYLDCAIKNYYDKRAAAVRAGIGSAVEPREKQAINDKRLYIASIQNELPKHLSGEFAYMREVLLDQYRDVVPAYVIGDLDENILLNFESLRVKAAELGCDRMSVAKIWGMKRRDETDTYKDVLIIEQTVYRVSDGATLDVRSHEKGSRYFTPLGALVSAAVALGAESSIWSGQ